MGSSGEPYRTYGISVSMPLIHRAWWIQGPNAYTIYLLSARRPMRWTAIDMHIGDLQNLSKRKEAVRILSLNITAGDTQMTINICWTCITPCPQKTPTSALSELDSRQMLHVSWECDFALLHTVPSPPQPVLPATYSQYAVRVPAVWTHMAAT